jgi:hypothetical protein
MYDELVEALRLCVRYGKAADVLANALKAAEGGNEVKETIIRQYRKKPIIVEAVQLDNINVPCVVRWVGEDKAKINLESDEAWKLGKAPPIFSVTISTLEGDMKAMPGDYIIKGVHGEFYPCKPDIFEKTYEAAPEPPKEETE